MKQSDLNNSEYMDSLAQLTMIHVSLFMLHAILLSACETTNSLSEMGFNSIRWFILVQLGVCFLAKLLDDEQSLAQTRCNYAATAVPDRKENKRKSTWIESVVHVLSYVATCAFLVWGVVTLYRFGTDPIKRAAYCVMITYPAPFLWCMRRLCSIEKDDVKSQKPLKYALHCSLIFMISNDTFCYAVLGAGKTILGAAILAIALFILIEWSCFFLTTNLTSDEKLENDSDRHIGDILTNAAICVLVLWSVISLYLQSDNLFLCAVCCITLLSPIPFILCVKAHSYALPEERRVVIGFLLTYSLACMCSCIAFCLSIVINIGSDDLEDTVTSGVVSAMVAFIAVFLGCLFVLNMPTFLGVQETASNGGNDKMVRFQAHHMAQAPNHPHCHLCCNRMLLPEIKSSTPKEAEPQCCPIPL